MPGLAVLIVLQQGAVIVLVVLHVERDAGIARQLGFRCVNSTRSQAGHIKGGLGATTWACTVVK